VKARAEAAAAVAAAEKKKLAEEAALKKKQRAENMSDLTTYGLIVLLVAIALYLLTNTK